MSNFQFVGIDPSLSRLAIVHGDSSFGGVKIFGSDATPPGVVNRMIRFGKMVSDIEAHLKTVNAIAPIRFVAIEGYSLGHNNNGTASICEFGGLLRYRLTHLYRLFDVPPASLKKFATGKSCDKVTYLTTMARKHDLTFAGEDEFFAYGLWLMARCAGDPTTGNKDQVKLVGECVNPQPKPKNKKAKNAD